MRAPPGFPAATELYRQGFENWSGALAVDDLWTCSPRDANEVVRLANWAHRAGWRLRARGAMHGWAPLCITAERDDRTVLLDTTRHWWAPRCLRPRSGGARRSGDPMDALSAWLGERGYGFLAAPATGEVTVGGGLAIGMHGASLPADGEVRGRGRSFGSLANLVVSVTAVVWSRSRKRYVLRTFHRSHRDAKAFLVHLGRTFVTEVTLRVAADQNVRCVSHVDIPARELFAPPGSAGRTFESFVGESGRVESIWFPFTENPWLKVWTPAPTKPASSREVSGPYNYPFSDTIPEEVAELADEIISGNTALTPYFTRVEYEVAAAGLAATAGTDIWGASANTHYYIRASTLRVEEQGLAVLTRRRDLQRVVSEFASFHERRLNELRAEGSFPINGPLEMRSCGLDDPAHVGIRGAEAPSLAPTVPRRDRRRWDTAVWMNVLTFPGTPGQHRYYAELDEWMRSNYAATRCCAPSGRRGGHARTRRCGRTSAASPTGFRRASGSAGARTRMGLDHANPRPLRPAPRFLEPVPRSAHAAGPGPAHRIVAPVDSGASKSAPVTLEREGAVTVVRMHHEEENRFHPDLLDALHGVLDELESGEEPAALVVTGHREVLLQRARPRVHGRHGEEVEAIVARVHALFGRVLGLADSHRRRDQRPRVRRRGDARPLVRPRRHARGPRLLLPAGGGPGHPVHAGDERADHRAAQPRGGSRVDGHGPPLRRSRGPGRRDRRRGRRRGRRAGPRGRQAAELAGKPRQALGAIKRGMYGAAIDLLAG